MHLTTVNLFGLLLCLSIFYTPLILPAQNANSNTKEIVLNIGHQRPIERLQFVNKDKYFISQDEYAILKIWDVASGKELYTVEDSTISVSTSFSTTKEAHILTYSYGDQQCWINLATGKLTVDPSIAEQEYLSSLDDDTPSASTKSILREENKIKNHSKYYAKPWSYDGRVELWSIEGPKLLKFGDFPTKEISLIDFNEKGNLLLLSDGQKIWLWDWQLDTIVHTCSDFFTNIDSYTQPYVMPSGAVFFVHLNKQYPSDRAYLKRVDLSTGMAHFSSIEGVNPEGNKRGHKVLSVDYSNRAYVSVLDQLSYPLPYTITYAKEVQATQFGRNLALITAGAERFIYWDAQNMREWYSINTKYKFYHFYIDEADQLLALIDATGINVHFLKSGELKLKIPYTCKDPSRLYLHFFPDNTRILINDSETQQVVIWDIEKNSEVLSFKPKLNFGRVIGVSIADQLIYTLSGRALITYDFSGAIVFYKVLVNRGIDAHYFPGQKKIIAAAASGVIYLINGLTGQLEKLIYLGGADKWLSKSQNGAVEASPDAIHYLHYLDKDGKISPVAANGFAQKSTIPVLLNGIVPKKTPATASVDSTETPGDFAVINAYWELNLQEPLRNKPDVGPKISHPWKGLYVKKAFFSKDEKLIVLVTETGCKIIERATGRLVKSCLSDNYKKIIPLLTADNRYLIQAVKANEIWIYDLSTSQTARKLVLEGHFITTLALSADGRSFFVGSSRGSILICGIGQANILNQLKITSAPILAIAIKQDNVGLAFADAYGNVYLIDLKTFKSIFLANRGSKGAIERLHFHPQRTQLLAYSLTHIFSLNYATKEPNHLELNLKKRPGLDAYFNELEPDQIMYFKVEPYGDKLLTYDQQQGKNVDSIEQINPLYGISGSGRYLLIGTNNGIKGMDLEKNLVFSVGDSAVELRQISLLGDVLYYNAKFSKGLKLLGINLRNHQTITNTTGYDTYGRLSRENNQLTLVGYFDGDLSGHGKKNIPNAEFVWKLPDQGPKNVTFSGNGSYLAYNPPFEHDTLLVYSVKTEKLIAKICLWQKYELQSFSISNNGRWLALKLRNKDFVHVYDLEKQAMHVLPGVMAAELSFSRKDNYLLVILHSSLKMVDYQNGRVVKEVKNYFSFVSIRAIPFLDKFGIIQSPDEPFQLWNLEKGQKLGNLYFYDNPSDTPCWVFVAVDGRYDGHPSALKFLYDVDTRNISSRAISPQNDLRYTPGLLLGQLK